MTETYPDVFLGTAMCCREWPVVSIFPIGRCGLCNERPVLKRV